MPGAEATRVGNPRERPGATGSHSRNDATNNKGKTRGPWTPPGATQGRDLARKRSIDSACPQWQQCLDGIMEKSGEERGTPATGEFKDKRVTGQEPSGSHKGTHTIQPAEIQESKRRKAQAQEKDRQGISDNGPPEEPRETGISKSLQGQECTTSVRRAHLSQVKEAPEAKQQA